MSYISIIPFPAYSIEIEKSLRSDDWTKNLSPYIELENKVRADFANPNRKWREGTAKTSFTYLLLDPRVTDNLPARANKQAHQISWVTFVNSIFYVGKGQLNIFGILHSAIGYIFNTQTNYWSGCIKTDIFMHTNVRGSNPR